MTQLYFIMPEDWIYCE